MKFLRKIFASKEVKAALGVLDELDYECNSYAFQLVRKQVESAILEEPEEFVSIITRQGKTPRQKIYSYLEKVAGDYLECGSRDYYVYRGLLNPTGEQLLRVYDRIIDQMREIDYISEEEARKQKSNIRKRIEEVG